MKHNFLIPLTAGLLIVFGITLVAMTITPAQTAASHTYTTKYSWYVMPQGKDIQPVLSDNETFRDDYDVIYLGSPEEKVIWLTFDAGYDNGSAPLLLDTLKAENIQAAFFICGNMIDTCPELVKRMADEGHLVLNHTNRHTDLSTLTKEEMAKELKDLEDKYYALTGRTMQKIVRPPEGNYSEECLANLTGLGYTTMFWSFAYKDWISEEQPSHEKAITTVMERVHPGMIALLHSNSDTNAAVLPEVVRMLREEGYRFGSFDELLEQQGESGGALNAA